MSSSSIKKRDENGWLSHNRQEESMLREFLLIEKATQDGHAKKREGKGVGSFREYFEKTKGPSV